VVLCQLNLHEEMNHVSRILLASAGPMALSGAAVAAHLTPKAPLPPPPPPPPLWTGFYMGVNAGGTWSNNNAVNTSAFPGPCDPIFFGCIAVPNISVTSAQLATFSVSRNNGAFIGGGQLGYNYQFGPSFVAGIEAEFGVTSACSPDTYQHSAATGIPISEVSTKNIVNPVRAIMKPDVPARRLPGKAHSEVRRAYWLAANSVAVSDDM
jgi:hypothetical protein